MPQQFKKGETIQGKKINNFMSFRTKETIYLSNNLPQLIIHEHAFETDDNSAFKQLLSKRSSSRLSKQKKDRQRQNLKENLFFHNLIKKVDINQQGETRRIRLKTSKQKQGNNSYNSYSKQKSKSKTKSKKKLTKKTKSMMRLIPNNQNLYRNQLPTKRKQRKSYSPTSYNNSQPKKLPTLFVKSTKFTQSKQQATKKIKTKQNEQQKQEKSKQKLKSKINLKSENKQKKKKKKINSSSSKVNLLSFDQQKNTFRNPLKKQIQKQQQKQKSKKSKQKKQKSMTEKTINRKKSKQKLTTNEQVQSHFQSTNDNFNLHFNQQKNLSKKYSSNRDSLPFNPKLNKKKQRNSLKLNIQGTTTDYLNKADQHNFKKKKSQKKCIISSNDINHLKIRNEAATKIQKVYKGYATRKWLKQYLILIHATVTIQRFWRGYQCRKKLKQLKIQSNKISKKMNKPKLELIQQQLLIESSEGQSYKSSKNKQTSSHHSQNSQNNMHMISYQQSQNFEKLKEILFQVMDQKSVDIKIKSRIKAFLEKQQVSGRNSLKSSQSRLSSQRLKQEIESEKKYFEKRQEKKQQKHSNQGAKSSNPPISPNYFPSKFSNSPYKEIQSYASPKNGSFSPLLSKSFRSSSDVLNNLFEIQEFHRQKLIETASKRKQQLNSLLKNMVVSPRTHKLKQKEVDQNLATELSKFEANISEVMQSCKKTQEQDQQLIKPMMITPQHISFRSPVQPYQIKQPLQELQRLQTIKNNEEPLQKYRFNFDTIVQNQSMQVQNIGVQIPSLEVSIKKLGEDPINEDNNIKKIDNSYNFVDEYLLTLIEFLRNKNNGEVMFQLVQNIKTFKTLSPQTVLRNLSIVPQDDQLDEAFALPLYKYLGDDKQLINQNYLMQFQKYFKIQQKLANQLNQQDLQLSNAQLNVTGEKLNLSPTLKKSQRNTSKSKLFDTQIEQHYLKLLQDSFNQALNTKRPSSYIFTQRSLTTINNIKRISQEEVDVQSQYQIYCANAMLDIFCWFGIKYGYGIDDQQITIQSKQYNEQAIKKILKTQAQKSWDQYYELLQLIAKLSQLICTQVIFQQTYSIAKVFTFR